MVRTLKVSVIIASFALVASSSGCNRDGSTPMRPLPSTPERAQDDAHHEHKPGTRGGNIVAIGTDNYHGEAVVEQGGTLRFFTLGHDETQLLEIDAEPVAAFVKAAGNAEAVPIVLRPEPQQGDTNGKTSQLLGQLPRELWGKSLEVTIPSLRIGGERFRVAFQTTSDAHTVAPTGTDVEDERRLYLTPGGIYTLEDIKANGNMTASAKFKGLKPSHDLKPKKGDKICPITLTKANPQFSWVVGGKTYEFCCPPCVQEFVTLAKEMSQDIKEPEYYRKK
jgi:YHS domain-containing protein